MKDKSSIIEKNIEIACSNTELIVQKSIPLLSLWRSELTLPEFKILDAYLACIDSSDPSCRKVRFEKDELEQLLGVQKINTSVLQERLKHLGIGVELEDPSLPEGFVTIFLFEKIQGGLDKNGQWIIELQCTESARRYIFNSDHIGYLRYKFKAIANLRSRYSYILFLYLEQNRCRKSWTITLENLQQLLHCDNVPIYQEFRRFNEKVLKRAQTELQDRNNYRFAYKPVKAGRRVTAIRFTVPDQTEFLPI